MSEDETIDQLTDRLNRTLNMSLSGPSVHNSGSSGLNNIQREQIREILNEVLGSQSPHLEEEIDQPIGTVTRLEELDKVPDIVRTLREFSGQPGEFNSWRKSVDRVMELFKSLQGTGRYYAILHTIRTKITGDADTALESYRTPLDWPRMKKCLMMHYSDKRDIGTLEYQMTVLCQGNRPITEFYQAVYQHLSLILDKVSCLNLDEGSLRSMTNTYRDKALDTFVRGLNGDLPRLLSVREPASLPEALHICLKLDNMAFRMNYAHGQISKGNIQRDRIGITNPFTGNRQKFFPELAYVGGTVHRRPPLPPRNTPVPNYNPNYSPNQNFRPIGYQQFGPRPQFNQGNPNGFQNHYNRPQYSTPNYPTPAPRVEPMEVDRSIQSRQVNYMNRPHDTAFKRAPTSSIQAPQKKMQRNFHVVTNNESRIQQPSHDVNNYYQEEGAVGGMNEIDEYYRQFANSGLEMAEYPPENSEIGENDPRTTDYPQEDLINDLNFFG